MNYGCKYGMPHDYQTLRENLKAKVEICVICGQRITFKKDSKERIDNNQYLKAHARNFAQPYGRTAKLWYALWHPELFNQNKDTWTAKLCLDQECIDKGSCKHREFDKQAVLPDLTKKGTNGSPQEYGYS